MRRTNGKDISANAGDSDLPFAADMSQSSGVDRSAPRYTPEQLELLNRGLRILARLAVRAYLLREASLPATNVGEQCLDNPSED